MSSEEEEADAGGVGEEEAGHCENTGHGMHIGDPSSSRPRSAEPVWPDHFVESLASRVAVDAARTGGRLAAAPAIATVFQVCSTWRSVSQSELLWEEITRCIWSGIHRHPITPATWHHEFASLHLTGRNFETGHYVYSSDAADGRSHRLALSDTHIAAGLVDGTVRVFRLHPSLAHVATYRPQPQHARLGLYSDTVSGLALLPKANPDRVVFASRAGDIHMCPLLPAPGEVDARRSHAGNPMESGPLVDFAADTRWWVGLFAGVPGQSWRVWDATTEQLVYVGGTLTDADAVRGWRTLAEFPAPSVGRARIVAALGAVVGCTASAIQVVDLEHRIGEVVAGHEFRRGANVDMADACDGNVMVADARGAVRVRRAGTLEEVCRFSSGVRGRGGGTGCMNWGFAAVSVGGEIRVWNASSGRFLYSLRLEEGVGSASAVAANERYVCAWCEDAALHVWDFGGDV